MEVFKIERAIEKLSAADLTAFRNWFAEFDAEAWDKQIEVDFKEGKLDGLIAEAISDIKAYITPKSKGENLGRSYHQRVCAS